MGVKAYVKRMRRANEILEEAKKVRKMYKDGKITKEERDRRLAALEKKLKDPELNKGLFE